MQPLLQIKKLSKKEMVVLQYSSKGYSAKEIAKIIGIKPDTVKKYNFNIRMKLKAKNMTHAIAIALTEKLLDLNINKF